MYTSLLGCLFVPACTCMCDCVCHISNFKTVHDTDMPFDPWFQQYVHRMMIPLIQNLFQDHQQVLHQVLQKLLP